MINADSHETTLRVLPFYNNANASIILKFSNFVTSQRHGMFSSYLMFLFMFSSVFIFSELSSGRFHLRWYIFFPIQLSPYDPFFFIYALLQDTYRLFKFKAESVFLFLVQVKQENVALI